MWTIKNAPAILISLHKMNNLLRARNKKRPETLRDRDWKLHRQLIEFWMPWSREGDISMLPFNYLKPEKAMNVYRERNGFLVDIFRGQIIIAHCQIPAQFRSHIPCQLCSWAKCPEAKFGFQKIFPGSVCHSKESLPGSLGFSISTLIPLYN